jgi:hypothetical protein
MFRFSNHPETNDYTNLASHIEQAPDNALHPSLSAMRTEVVASLRQMADEPDHQAHQSVYQGLRLFVWE